MDYKDQESGRPGSDASTPQTGVAPIYELKVVREPSRYDAARYLKSPQDIYKAFHERYQKLDREEFSIIFLDNKNRMLGHSIVSLGSLTAAVVHPREVFKAAVLANAARILLMHNHPSGDPTPSREDIDISKRLKKAGQIMGIDILDHVIIGDGRYFSFSEQGML